MTTNIADEIFNKLHEHGDKPVKIQDEKSGEVCWIISDRQKKRMVELDDSSDVSPYEVSLLVEQAMAEDDADDPSLESYQNISKES